MRRKVTDFFTIFCPQCRNLILDSPSCPECGWVRELGEGEVGEVAWRGDVGAKVASKVASSRGLVVFGTEDGFVKAWDARKGEEEWRFQLPEGWLTAEGLAVFKDRLYIACDDRRDMAPRDKALIALKLQSGQELWRYPVGAARLSAPLAHRGRIYFASSDNSLHAVDASGRKVWRVDTEGWGRTAPAVGGDLIFAPASHIPPEACLLQAFRISDGEKVWDFAASGPFFTPAFADGVLYLASWSGMLYALDAKSGRKLWDFSTPRQILTAPVVFGNLVVFAARDRKIYALERSEGEVAWTLQTKGKVRGTPLAWEGAIYAATDKGKVYAIEASRGRAAWPQPLEVGDGVRHGLAAEGGRLFIATRHGKLLAVNIRRPEKPLAPAEYERRGEYGKAAVAYALEGEFGKAARIYRRLGKPFEAAQLFERAGELAEAARAYEEAGEWARAQRLYRELNEPLKVALMAERLGNYGEAATLYERERAYAEAGRNYERARQLAKAAQMYQLAGDMEGAERCYRAQGEKAKLAELCLQRGELLKAAEIYQEMGDLLRAAEIYLEAGMPRKAGELYERMEAWERALELYRQLGDVGREALCLERLGMLLEAARAYERAAKELADAGGAEEEVARLYRRAAYCYEKVFEEEKCAECRRKVIRYEKLPDIVVRVKQDKEFVFQETNILSFEVQNDGFGLAYDIELRIFGRFEEEEEPLRLRGLRPKRGFSRPLAVKPLDIGEHVPIEVEVSYMDERGRRYNKRVREYVDVKRERTLERFAPRYVIVEGDFIQAQQYTEKRGDWVEIIRGERREEVREEEIARCQRCGSQLQAGYKFCPKCGYKVE